MKKLAAYFVIALLLAPAAAFGGAIEDAALAQLSGNPSKAINILTPLATNGDGKAQSLLGSIYDDGSVTPEIRALQGTSVAVDLKKAFYWFQKAAEQDSCVAQLRLGEFFRVGSPVPQDYVQAHKWYNLAAAHSEPEHAQTALEAKKQRDLLASQMTKDQIVEAQKLARDWRLK